MKNRATCSVTSARGRLTALAATLAMLSSSCGVDYLRVGPYLERVTADAAAISWETAEPEESVVEWGATEAYGMRCERPGATLFHRVVLSGLSAETLYHYRIVSGAGDGLDYTFTTAPVGPAPVRFAVYGDSQDGTETHAKIANAILRSAPEFVLHLGDTVRNGNVPGEWVEQFFTPAAELLARVPVYVTMGNHERSSPLFFKYHFYEGGRSYYSFAHGPAFVVTVNTSESFRPGSPQHEWLVATLSSERAQAAPWLFVTYHEPAYTQGWGTCTYDGHRGARNILTPLMEQYGVDVVFNGHMHGYERGRLNGVHYVLSGGGGGELDEHCQNWPSIDVSMYVHNYLTVEIDGASLRIMAHRPNGEVFDEIALDK
jgi:predicted phosphodiesterase